MDTKATDMIRRSFQETFIIVRRKPTYLTMRTVHGGDSNTLDVPKGNTVTMDTIK